MFREEGAGRTHRLNRLLAGYLALVGGCVNATGVVVLGVFTSHMTGNVTRMVTDLASRKREAAVFDLAIVGAFFGGALLASVVVESNFFGSTSKAYGVALSIETAALLVFAGIPHGASSGSRAPAEALSLCLAMGIQNSLVTRLSGAVVRTTHLTGVITDLGIEAARWIRWWRVDTARRLGIKLAFGQNPAVRPPGAKVALLATIASCFVLGALIGGMGSLAYGRWVIVVPVAALAGGAIYAFASRPLRTPGSIPPNSRD
jgi:uncharacterized membrane protein YoaK (UPF0700 family)